MASVHTPGAHDLDVAIAIGVNIVGVDFSFSGPPGIVDPNTGDIDLSGLPGGVDILFTIQSPGFCWANDGSNSAAEAIFIAARQADKDGQHPLPSVFRDAQLLGGADLVLSVTSKNNDHKQYYYQLNVFGQGGPVSYDPMITNR